MGYGTRDGGWKDSIETFWPDDTDTEFYIAEDATLWEIMQRAKEKWPDCDVYQNITVSAEYIHTDCLGYDLYDAGDYTRFLKITKKE